MTMTESECFDTRSELDACYPCPDVDCDGVVEYETTGYWQCSKCSFRTKHKPARRGNKEMTDPIKLLNEVKTDAEGHKKLLMVIDWLQFACPFLNDPKFYQPAEGRGGEE